MTKNQYDHEKIEKKWQKFWKDKNIFASKKDLNKPKYYILDMFPYPSGAGLHVGHVTGYTGTDIMTRYKRQQGYNVLHPMGWDSFGLPAEQYAIRTGTHPSITTKKDIKTYRDQLQSLGLSYDWDREFATSDPSYYKWTQWIFTKLFEMGLAYEAEVSVNYCPELGTVLANEEVENGKSKEGGYPVYKRPLRQWILKITEYADRLISDLDLVDWPDNLKKLQTNWIGKSEGAKVVFLEKESKEEINIFTTRPDTLFGATYLVLAPEHHLVKKITKKAQKEEVENYLLKTSQKSDLERTDLAKEKTGVWTGSYAIHPITGKEIPIWVSDYVLMGYGTGAIMCVPAHDERDFEFAHKFNLPVVCVYDPDIEDKDLKNKILNEKECFVGDGVCINSACDLLSLNSLTVSEAKEKVNYWLEHNKKGERSVNYKIRDWLFSRQRYWGEPVPILHFEDGTKRALQLDELPLTPPEIEDYKPAKDGNSPLSKEKKWVEIIDEKTGKKAVRETNTMPQWAGSCWYYLRFCDPHNDQKAWGEDLEKYWMPVDLYIGGAEHAVLHLLYARFWHKVLYDCKLVSTLEPFQKYRYQGIITAPSYKLNEGGYVSPEHVKKKGDAFYCINSNKPVTQLIEKMSKSKLNGVSPDEMIIEFGADSLRLYEMFMGPFDREKLWNTDAVSGCKRFLNRFFDMVYSDKVVDEEFAEANKLSHRLVNGVVKDIEEMQFNTAIAKMMEFINAFTKLDKYPKNALKMAVQMLYPFAPHVSEEMWQHLGEKESLTYVPISKIDPKYLVDDTICYVIQVNGKFRGRVELSKGKTKEELLEYAKSNSAISKHITDVIKVIFVPDKLLNIVVK